MNATAASLRVVHLVTEECGPDVPNGVLRTVFHLSDAQRRLGHAAMVLRHDATSGTQRRTPFGHGSSLWTRISQVTCYVPPSLRSEILMARPDIVHLHSIHVPENVGVGAFLTRAGIPYCVTINGGLAPVARRRRRIRKWAFRVLWEQQYLDTAAFLHAVTPQERFDLCEYGIRVPIVVAPNAVQIETLPQPQDVNALWSAAPALKNRRVFLFVGRLDPNQKGLDTLVEAFRLADVPDASLVLVGPDWKNGRAKLTSLVARHGLHDRVVFLGPAYGQRQADLMAGADVFVHTSRWEGLSFSVLEAAAWQKPCLLTPAADPLGALGDGGGAVIAEGTVEGVATGIRTMAAMDGERLRAMGQHAHEIVADTFTWRHTAARVLDAYREFCMPRHVVGVA